MARKIHWKQSKVPWKPSVNPRDLQDVMKKALLIVDQEFKKYNKEVTITCTGQDSHKPSSQHPWGLAFDVRILWLGLSETTINMLYSLIKGRFKGTGYQIINEKNHFHVEYDPNKD